MEMKTENVLYLPSGRIFLQRTADNYLIESTEMRDVSVDGKLHAEVRESSDPHVIWKHLVPYDKKWLLTVSTQKGCTHNCQFCDVANLPFKGNLSFYEIYDQIVNILSCTPYVKECEKVKIGFARMGEPAWNMENVLAVMKSLANISKDLGRKFNWLPCFNSILPKKVDDCIERVIEVKEIHYNGFLHFQISCNSTDEEKRKELFGGANVFEVEEIIKRVQKEKITNRTVTLNFIVMDGVEVSVEKLMKMNLNPDLFTVKLIPLNNTINSVDNNLKTYANYSNYQKLLELKDDFNKAGVPVVVDAIAKCEEAGLCCGQLAQIFQ
jgi:23S rRNA (adenine2503-C2)-methyltransferase